MDNVIESKVSQWLNGQFDGDTVSAIRKLQQENPDELADAFYRNLEFGTGLADRAGREV